METEDVGANNNEIGTSEKLVEAKGETQVSVASVTSAAKTETFAETKQHEFDPTIIGPCSPVESTTIEEARSSSDGDKDPTSREKDLLNSLEEAGHTEAVKLNINSEDETLGQDEDMKGLLEPGAKQQLRNVKE